MTQADTAPDHPAPAQAYRALLPGDPVPYFRQRTPANPHYTFDTAAGRYIVLAFVGSTADAAGQAALNKVLARPDLFNDDHTSCFAVSVDPADESEGRLQNRVPGFRVFWDFDLTISRLYGAVPEARVEGGPLGFRRFWLLLDPTLRVIANIPFRPDGGDAADLVAKVAALPPPERFAGFAVPAPVLVLPQVFEPDLCRALIADYDRQGGEESGFMREIDGRTVGVQDAGHKRRRDATITDPDLVKAVQGRILRRVVPEIAKAHQFHVTRMERYIVGCYSAEDGGHFAAHRDNTTKGTAHRRFAVSVHLSEGFEGGEVCFPEYGPGCFKAPTGGAVVFSCSLLHRVRPVTAGRRYVFLPFLYDDAAAEIRRRNMGFVGAGEEAAAAAPAPEGSAPAA